MFPLVLCRNPRKWPRWAETY